MHGKSGAETASTAFLVPDSLRLNHAPPALFAFVHDLVGKLVPTFPDHALVPAQEVEHGLVEGLGLLPGDRVSGLGDQAPLVTLQMPGPEPDRPGRRR